MSDYISPPGEWRAPTNQLCGLYMPAAGGAAPNVGVPLGKGITSRRTTCGDPISWFVLARLIHQPSWTVLGLPALGKSTLVRRIIIGLAGLAAPLVLGDIKGEYVDTIRALGGQVVPLGRGRGHLNVLEVGAMDEAAARIGEAAGARLREDAHSRRYNVLRSLLAITRGQPIDDRESIILNTALRHLARRWRRKLPPLPSDLIKLINEAPDDVRAVTLDRGDISRYRDAVDNLVLSLMSLCDGPFGDIFAKHTTQRIQLDTPGGVCVDISSINDTDRKLQAAGLTACWNEGYSTIEANNALADAGVQPQRWFLAVVDELWQALRDVRIEEEIDAIGRLNRHKGIGQILISHSGRDMPPGFLERSGALALLGLPDRELEALQPIVGFTEREREMVSGWTTPRGWEETAVPPGRGNVLLKVGGRPGVDLHVDLVPAENGLNATSRRWEDNGIAHNSLAVTR
jgi:hypothetical protein